MERDLVDDEEYYFRGEPFFIGNLTKELVAASVFSAANMKPLVIGYETDILFSTSGKCCPVAYGDVVSEGSLEDVYAYVQHIARQTWKRGVKYYFGRPLHA